jgi:hypothetical protein
MITIKNYILIFLISFSVIYYCCDDAGQNPQWVPKGQVSFSFTNLKHLLPAIDGYYHLWLALDFPGNRTWYELGRFNISTAGEMVDTLGNSIVFNFTGDTNTLEYASKSTLTVGIDPNPEGSVLMSSDLTIGADSITGSLWLGHDMALGDVGKRILGSGFPMAGGGYMLQSPTTNNAQCSKGIWFCDTLGNATFAQGLSLNSGNGWVFEGWIEDESANRYYSIGKFYNFYNADLDGAGPCAGSSGTGFNKPGQDFILTDPGCPTISSIMNGNFGVFVTIEVENETGAALSNPFYLKLFYQGNIVNGLGCKRFDNIFNQTIYNVMPRGRLRITY